MTRTSLWSRRLVMAAAAAGLACAATPAAADSPVDLRIVDRSAGRELPTWPFRGRLFVAGDPGARYSLRVSNRTGGRVLVVLSVDGVNVLTGETGKYDQRGYVLDPYETYDITGWRKSNTEVASFTFAALSRSYAARTGRPGDVGVVGMAVFAERPPPLVLEPQPAPRPEARRRSGRGWADAAPPPPLPIPPVAAPAPSARSAAPSAQATARADAGAFAPERREERLGTAHGAREWSVAQTTSFERATSYPQAVRQIEYDTYANLVARGVIRGSPPPPHRPRPFPLEPGPGGFVPDPPGRF